MQKGVASKACEQIYYKVYNKFTPRFHKWIKQISFRVHLLRLL